MKTLNSVEDLKEYLKLDDTSLNGGLKEPYKKLALLWENDEPKTAEQIINWYKIPEVQEAYLFDLVAYWQTPYKKDDLERFNKIIADYTLKTARILDYGAGIGEVVLTLALNNPTLNFVYMDFAGGLMDFAKWRAEKYNIKNVEFKELEPLKREEYEGVICLDTLEHVPNVKDVTIMLCASLKNFGFFIVQAPFGHTQTHPQHLKSNDIEAGLLPEYLSTNYMQKLENYTDVYCRHL